MYNFIKSYLTNCKQFTFYNKCVSELSNVHIGLPRRSCLGPLLFLIHTNNLKYLFQDIIIIFYADDTVLCRCDRNLDLLCTFLNYRV